MRGRHGIEALLVVCLAAASAGAQPRPPGEGRLPPEELRARRERWERFPPAERRRLLQQYEHWRGLPGDERKALRARLERLEKLTADQREVLRRRLQTWSKLPGDERERMRRRLGYWRQLPRTERERIGRALWVLKNLLPAEFETFKNSTGPQHEKHRRALAHKLTALLARPTEELHRLAELPPDARGQAIEELLRQPPPTRGGGRRLRGQPPREAAPNHSGGK